MAIQEVATCDECGATKREVNHWWIGYTFAHGGWFICSWAQRWFQHYVGGQAPTTETHLCGSGCVSKWTNKQLERENANSNTLS